MKNDLECAKLIKLRLKHLLFLQKAASSVNLFEKNYVVFCVAVNDYRYYKSKFQAKYGKKAQEIIENNSGAQSEWRKIKHPYDGKTKYGFKVRKQENWYNTAWSCKSFGL